jgi:hypothetical protein
VHAWAHVNGHAREQARVTVPSISRSTKVCFSQASASAVLIGTQQAAAAAAKTPVNQWTIEELCAFFAAQKLDVHIAAIKQNGVDGGMLLDLIAEDALGELGIKSTLHKLRIKRGLEASTVDRPKVAGADAVVSRSSLLCASDVLLP